MIEKRLQELWRQLRGKKPQMPHFLGAMLLDGIRGTDKLSILFDYPVSVIAGRNASGKSTVLFAASCAYRGVGGVYGYTPSKIFLDYRPNQGKYSDPGGAAHIAYGYSTPRGPATWVWQRMDGMWCEHSGQEHSERPQNTEQPERHVYLHTLSNLGDPSEKIGMYEMSRLNPPPQEKQLTPAQITFAQRMLPFDYDEVVNLSDREKSMLFVTNQNGASYSELHMAGGERSALHIAQGIAQLQDALILIDEVETGLHPLAQQILMMELQQLALRNNLQIIVTTHSPVVLDSVPDTGRIFLDRDQNGKVIVHPPYRDIIQDVLYGRCRDKLIVLCEDKVAESILEGILDVLIPKNNIRRSAIHMGRDTGADEFPGHAAAFQKMNLSGKCVFVLDGDRRESSVERKIQKQASTLPMEILFLPGKHAPEEWIWSCLKANPDVWTSHLGCDKNTLASNIKRLNDMYDSANGSLSEIAKHKLARLAEDVLSQSVPNLCRIVARALADDKDSEVYLLVENLEKILEQWRYY